MLLHRSEYLSYYEAFTYTDQIAYHAKCSSYLQCTFKLAMICLAIPSKKQGQQSADCGHFTGKAMTYSTRQTQVHADISRRGSSHPSQIFLFAKFLRKHMARSAIPAASHFYRTTLWLHHVRPSLHILGLPKFVSPLEALGDHVCTARAQQEYSKSLHSKSTARVQQESAQQEHSKSTARVCTARAQQEYRKSLHSKSTARVQKESAQQEHSKRRISRGVGCRTHTYASNQNKPKPG